MADKYEIRKNTNGHEISFVAFRIFRTLSYFVPRFNYKTLKASIRLLLLNFVFMSEGFEKKQKVYTQRQALVKAESWCAYQERCQQEVRDKMYSWGLHANEVENVIAELISKNFLNEERFAKAYAGGKFRIKKWGRVKIRIELKRRKLSEYCIKKGLAEIDEDDYRKTLKKIAGEKTKATKEKNAMKKKYKVMSFLISKGYENELVREVVGELE